MRFFYANAPLGVKGKLGWCRRNRQNERQLSSAGILLVLCEPVFFQLLSSFCRKTGKWRCSPGTSAIPPRFSLFATNETMGPFWATNGTDEKEKQKRAGCRGGRWRALRRRRRHSARDINRGRVWGTGPAGRGRCRFALQESKFDADPRRRRLMHIKHHKRSGKLTNDTW